MGHYAYEHSEKMVGPFRCVVAGMDYSGDLNPRDNDNISTLAFVYSYRHMTDSHAESIDEDLEVECPTCEGSGEVEDDWRVQSGHRDVASGFASEDEARAWAERLDVTFHQSGIYVVPVTCDDCDGYGRREVGIVDYVRRTVGDPVAYAVGIRYDDFGSSGSKVYVCDDDDRANGVAYVTEADVEKMGASRDSLADQVAAELREYEDWCNGNVYEWAVEDEDGDIIDSVCGFIGDESADYAMTEAVAHAEWLMREREREAREAAYWQARGVETV